MSEMTMMNPEQMEEVSGGLYQGRLSPKECKFETEIIKGYKLLGLSKEQALEAVKARTDKDKEYLDAACEYVQTFWDHPSTVYKPRC